jgi:hypothetical protein
MNRFTILICFLLLNFTVFSKSYFEVFLLNSSGFFKEAGTGYFTQYDKTSGKSYSESKYLKGDDVEKSVDYFQIKYSSDFSKHFRAGISSGFISSSSNYRFSTECIPVILHLNLNRKFFNSFLELGVEGGAGVAFPIKDSFDEDLTVKRGLIKEFGFYSKFNFNRINIILYIPASTSLVFPVKTKEHTFETSDSIITYSDKYDLGLNISSCKLGVGYEF